MSHDLHPGPSHVRSHALTRCGEHGIAAHAHTDSADSTRTSVVRVLAASVAIAVACAVAVAVAIPRAAPSGAVPSVVVAEDGDFRYEFHVFTGREFLWRTDAATADRRDVLGAQPDAARRLRRTCERRLRVESLDELHAPHRSEAEALRGLGYL